MIALLWILNFAISVFNSWSVGNVWDSTKAKGGIAHFMTWMGAIMAASGFTWCYLIVIGLVGAMLPMSLFVEQPEGVEAVVVTGSLVTPEMLKAFFELGYLVIIFPILGSGLAITVNTWREFARSRQRSGADYAITGWNTFAQVHNTYSAIQHIPSVLDGLGDFFFAKGGKSDDKGKGLVVVLVIMALLAGILTTAAIIQARRRAVLMNEQLAMMAA